MIRDLLRQGLAMLRQCRQCLSQSTLQPAPLATLQGSLELVDVSFDSWLQSFRETIPRVYGGLAEADVSAMATRFPQHSLRVISAANATLNHQFNHLGSGFFDCIDPDRAVVDGYVPIDWFLDPVRELRFAQKVPHREWDLFAMRPENADIKFPWELGRCQAWVSLGQAFLLCGEDRYAKEIANQLRDFMQANPVGLGINWTCTMDVAIRAANWAIALNQIRHCAALDEDFWQEACVALFAHGAFIRDNLENNYEVTSNHFLSNIVGLYFVGAIFTDLDAGAQWLAFARKCVEEEIVVQICADGADYESSIPYHRLVTELFLGAARLDDLHGALLSSNFVQRLDAMVDFQAGTLRPDGLMPQVGDADDGRLHIFAGVGHWTAQDARHLFGPATSQFKADKWRALLNEDAVWESAWWGFDVTAMAPVSGPLPRNCTLYPDAGIAIVREQGNYLLVSNGCVGTHGFGNHKHNDLLGFEYHREHQPWVVDPGSYVYTSDFAARNAFRSVRAHNTLQLDDQEPNEFREEWLFRMFEKAEPEHLEFKQGVDLVQYTGCHRGYERVDGGGVHTRVFQYHRDSAALAIGDRLVGSGVHMLHWRIHLAPGVTAIEVEPTRVVLAAQDARLYVFGPNGATVSVLDDWYSAGYGARTATQCLMFSLQQPLSTDSCWSMVLSGDDDVAAAAELAVNVEAPLRASCE